MADIVQQLRSLNATINGVGFLGPLESFTPPNLQIATEDYKGNGMDAPVALDMGMERLEAQFVLNGIFGEGVLSHFGLKQGDAASATVRGALQDFDNSVTPVEFQMTGSIIAVERSPLGNEQAQETVTMSLTYYKETIGSDTPVEIDVLNQRRVIDGEDQLEAIRNAIGA